MAAHVRRDLNAGTVTLGGFSFFFSSARDADDWADILWARVAESRQTLQVQRAWTSAGLSKALGLDKDGNAATDCGDSAPDHGSSLDVIGSAKPSRPGYE